MIQKDWEDSIHLSSYFWWLPVLLVLGSACSNDNAKALFRDVPVSESRVDFENTITETHSLNMLEYANFYTGAGVAAGDFNNDGLDDLFFGGNLVTSRLFINKGHLRFEDISTKAGVTTHSWINGIALADVNQDGWLDIYLSVSGKPGPAGTRNLLFINNHDLTFSEQAARYGIDDPGATTQSVFLDYDKDGDLDLFLAQNAVQLESKVNYISKVGPEPAAPSTDKLYRNNGDQTFTDVSSDAGIVFGGYSLGVVAGDVNGDSWDDIFVSNDFQGNDLLYINNGNGTFSEQARKYFRHSSFAGMGADMRDINHDAIPDILVLDMLAEGSARQKLLMDWPAHERYLMSLEMGYLPQYTRNTLQISNGKDYSEIGQFAGIESTDWSWAPLFGDFDNDNDQDILVTNGFVRDLGDKDFVDYFNPHSTFGAAGNKEEVLKMIAQKDGVPLVNYVFENNGNLTFTNRAKEWGINRGTYSYGATLSDLDNDGDLELVVNNSNSPAQIFENRQEAVTKNNFLEIRFLGKDYNREALGAKVWLYCGGSLTYYQHYPYRGYLSSISHVAHFGLAKAAIVDSIRIQWPGGQEEVLLNVRANQILTVNERNNKSKPNTNSFEKKTSAMRVAVANVGIEFTHKERPSIDFRNQPLIPHMHSSNGPGFAVGDVNRDGMDDLFVGGDAGQSGVLFFQQREGTFRPSSNSFKPEYDDMGSLFFDVDRDGDLDLLIASGGTLYPEGSENYSDRLYLNDGKGNFTETLLSASSSSSVVAGADYDKDGDIDVFVGGRVVPGEYPRAPKSKLYRNQSSKAKPVDLQNIANQVIGLEEVGMVTAAIWSDFDNDSWVDLVLVGEWMPLTLFKNHEGILKKFEPGSLSHTTGWWNSLVGSDIDHDGDIDYIAGNLGLNSRYTCSRIEPIRLYAKDFDNNGKVDPVMCMFINGEEHVPYFRGQLNGQLPHLKKKFTSYEMFSKAGFHDIFNESDLQGARVLTAETFASSCFINNGNGDFEMKPLPLEIQISPVNGLHVEDLNGDGNDDILMVGNSYANDAFVGRDDAGIGACVIGDGKGNFKYASSRETGFRADLDAKALGSIVVGTNQYLVVTNNNGPVETYRLTPDSTTHLIRLEPSDEFAFITLRNGTKYKQEFYYGGSYLSQSSRCLRISSKMETIEIVQFNGDRRFVNH